MSANIFNTIKSRFSGLTGETTLYYPGCMTAYNLTNVLNNYKSLLSDFGINFIMLDELSCCGSPLLSTGCVRDFEEIKKKNLEILKRHGIRKIVTNCPHCYAVFKKHYGVEVEHITQILEKNKHKIAFKHKEEVAYHDPCLLARRNNIIKEPRALLRQAGFKIIEPLKNREKTFCCGAGGGLKQNNPVLADKIAKERLRQLGSKKIIASCPYCYAHLKENVDNKKSIIELSETLIEA